MKVAAILFVASLLSGAVLGETTITVNGKKIRTSGNNIMANRNVIIVDGKILSGKVVEGSGQKATDDRDLGAFNALQLNISAEVSVTAGKKRQCRITTDDNILPLILTECAGNVLKISAKESYAATRKVKIAIETPLLTGATINGSGKIDIAEVTTDKLFLVINGAGDMAAKGKVARLAATINGSGDLLATHLEVKSGTITVNGSGDADVNVTDVLTAKVSGSGGITYAGSPAKVHTSVTGSGGISKKKTE